MGTAMGRHPNHDEGWGEVRQGQGSRWWARLEGNGVTGEW